MAWLYNDLVTAITGAVARPDLVGSIPGWIYLFEQEANLDLRRREMEFRATTLTTPGQAAYALPNGYAEAISMHLNPASLPIRVLQPSSWDRVKALNPLDVWAEPQQWAVSADQFLLGPTPDDVYTLELAYHREIPNVTPSAPSNWLLADYPAVYLYGTLVQASNVVADPMRAALWGSSFDRAMQRLIKDQVREDGFGGGPVLRADGVPSDSVPGFNILTGIF